MKISYVKLIFKRESSILYVKYMFSMLAFRMWILNYVISHVN